MGAANPFTAIFSCVCRALVGLCRYAGWFAHSRLPGLVRGQKGWPHPLLRHPAFHTRPVTRSLPQNTKTSVWVAAGGVAPDASAASLWCVPYERSLRNIAPSLMSSPTTPIPSISTGSSRRTRWRQDGRHALALFDAELPATDRGTLSEPPNLTMSARTTPLGSARWALRNMRSGGERRLEAVTAPECWASFGSRCFPPSALP